MQSAITLSLIPEFRGGPFVLSGNLAEGFARAADLGFDAIEIFPASADDLDARELKRLMEKHRLPIAAIGTGAGWVRHKLRLTDPEPGVRRRALEFVAALVDLAGSFGAPAIVGSMQGRWEGDVSRAQAVAWLTEAFEQLGPRAHAQGVPLLYEPLNRYETNLFNRIAETVEFIQTLRTRNVRILADLFHMNLEEADLPGALDAAGHNLGHVHFADSNRLAVGLGHTPMPPIIAALHRIGFKGFLSAEVLPFPDSETAARQSLASFRNLTRAS